MGGMAGGMGSVVAGVTSDAISPLTQTAQGGGLSNSVAGFGVAAPVVAVKPETPPQTAVPTATDDMTAFKQRIEKLKVMKETGMLSDEEFEAEKKKLLSGL
jgi:hypothetical protein